MKKFLIISILLITASISFGQLKIGYIDSDAIMDNLPDVQDARQNLIFLFRNGKLS